MADLTDRQAAIDAIYAEFEYVYCYNCDHEGNEEWCEDCHRKYMKWSASRDTIERVLNDLPSEQPEIIRCKDCKHYNAGFECLIEGYGIERNKDWFCADAERGTDEDR